MTTFKWLLIFKDGAHLTANGEEIADACQSVSREPQDIAISGAGFRKATPLKRIDNIPAMSEETKTLLKEHGKEKTKRKKEVTGTFFRALKKNSKKRKSSHARSGWGFQPARKLS